MESKPKKAFGNRASTYPFNRTSMESKHKSQTPDCAAKRHTFNRTSMESKHASSTFSRFHRDTFNRTSMESKQYCRGCHDRANERTFNRTSMESKHTLWLQCEVRVYLLIEPVWNRNRTIQNLADDADSLLIEPVWNRNLSWFESGTVQSDAPFNRTSMESKQKITIVLNFSIVSFNRTSMESKQCTQHGVWRWQAVLLIEPVWNRNTSSLASLAKALSF